METYIKQWDTNAGTPRINNIIATKDWEEEPYFCFRGILSSGKALETLFNFYGKELHLKRFLELGCGNGRETRYFSDVFDYIEAIDSSENMIKSGKKRNPLKSIKWKVNNGLQLPTENNSIDIVYSYIVLQHCVREVVLSYFKEVKRVLKENGIFMFQIHIGKEHKEPGDYLSYSYWTEDEIREELSDMECVSFPQDNQMGFIIYRKKVV